METQASMATNDFETKKLDFLLKLDLQFITNKQFNKHSLRIINVVSLYKFLAL